MTNPEARTPPDSEFRYIGMSERNIRLLADQPNSLRLLVYEELLAELMEDGPGHEGKHRTVDI